MKLFNFNGRYLGKVLQPRDKQGEVPDQRFINLVPLKQSYDSQYFLLARLNGTFWEGGVARINKNVKQRQYEFDEIAKIERLCEKSDFDSTFFQVDTDGELYSVEFVYSDEEEVEEAQQDKLVCYSQYHRFSKWTQIKITVPRLEIKVDDKVYTEAEKDIHVDLTKNYVVMMRRNGKIYKIPKAQILERDKETFELEHSPVTIPIDYFYEDVEVVDEIGLKWMYVGDLVQFKLKSCLIQYDL